MPYDTAEDKKLAELALAGQELPPDPDPVISAQAGPMINFGIPAEAGGGNSGSGEDGNVVNPPPPPTGQSGGWMQPGNSWLGFGSGTLTSPPSGPGLGSSSPSGQTPTGEGPPTNLPPPAQPAPVVPPPVSLTARGEAGTPDMGVAHQGATQATGTVKTGLEIGTGPWSHVTAVKPTLDWREEENARMQAQAGLAARGQAAVAGEGAMDKSLADAKYFQEKNAERERVVQDRMTEAHRMQDARMRYLHDDIAKNPVDADKYIHDMPIWAKAVMLIGAAAGGFLQGFKGIQGNATMDAFKDAIGRSVEAQRTALEGKYKNIDLENNLFAQNMNVYKDQIAAIHGATADHWMLARAEAENIKNHTASEQDRANVDIEISKMSMEEAKARREAGLRFNVVTNESVAAKQQAEQAAKTKALVSEADRLAQGLPDIVAGKNPHVPINAPQGQGKPGAPAKPSVNMRASTPADGEPVGVGGNTVVFVPKGPDGDIFKKRLEAAKTGHSTETVEQILSGSGFYFGQKTGPNTPPVITDQVARGEPTAAPQVAGKGAKPPTGRQISAEQVNQLADPSNPQIPGTLSGLKGVDFSALDVPHARRLAQSLYHQADLLGVGAEVKALIPEDPHALGSQMHWDEKVAEAAKLMNDARASRWTAKEKLSEAGVTGGVDPTDLQ